LHARLGSGDIVALFPEGTTTFGDDKDRVLVRSGGEHTYFASDIAYHQLKRQRGYERQLDVILDRLEMSHVLELKERLLLDPETLPPADLLLTKLQVVEINERDLKDAAALLHDTVIDGERVGELAGSDWGWWRTMTQNLDHVASWCETLSGFEEGRERIVRQIDELRKRIDEQPKSMRWKVRARVGERVRWYELPEEVEQ